MQLVKDDYYTLLGVTRDASAKDIKQAYYKVAKVYHPDARINPDPESPYTVSTLGRQDHFKIVTQAYRTLSDEQKRSEYDKTLSPEFRSWDDPVDKRRARENGDEEEDPFQHISRLRPHAHQVQVDAWGSFGQVQPGDRPAPNGKRKRKSTESLSDLMKAEKEKERQLGRHAMARTFMQLSVGAVLGAAVFLVLAI